jgi:diguanylate cyclase (GGDEF)-like protein/putative nucleotidyltransferase with HDIG domain/PAS domain S-box-containing protein
VSPTTASQSDPSGRLSPAEALAELMASSRPAQSELPKRGRSPAISTHPTDTSRILLGLMNLARRADETQTDPRNDSLHGAISRNVLRSLLSALHHRDENTILHSRRVALLSVGIAKYLGWTEVQLKMLEVAALLHDIGKIGVPDHILFKPGKLSADEAELMALHHNIAIDVLQACRVHKEVLDIVLQSHLHYNGANDGYRRIGSDMHQGARILAVADAYESLISQQVYRKGKSHKEALKILMDAAGAQFDGNVVLSLSRWVDTEGLPFEGKRASADRNAEWTQSLTQEEIQEANSLCHIFSYLYLLESLYDGFYMVDADQRFVIWNCGAERLLGYSPHAMTNHTWSSRLLRQASLEGNELRDPDCPLNIVMKSRRAVTNIMKWRHANGQWVDAEAQTVPLLGYDGQLEGVAEIFRDLSRTSRRPLEYRELKLAASRDALTSVANRGELETQLTLLVNDFNNKKKKQTFSVIFLDIDHFKPVNDTYGHAAGDQVLIETARLMQHETYSGELVGRYGGEEFVILCPSTKLDQAYKRAERIRQAISRREISHLGGRSITASFGVAQMEPGDSVASLFRRADRALYISKEGGRNRTTTLTNEQFLAGASPEPIKKEALADPFVFRTTFLACVAAEMIVYKLGGFVNDQGAHLADANSEEATITLGSRGLLGGWGNTEDRQPVTVNVRFSPKSHSAKTGASQKVPVDVVIRPRGRIRDADVFQARAKRVLKALREYFQAE